MSPTPAPARLPAPPRSPPAEAAPAPARAPASAPRPRGRRTSDRSARAHDPQQGRLPRARGCHHREVPVLGEGLQRREAPGHPPLREPRLQQVVLVGLGDLRSFVRAQLGLAQLAVERPFVFLHAAHVAVEAQPSRHVEVEQVGAAEPRSALVVSDVPQHLDPTPGPRQRIQQPFQHGREHGRGFYPDRPAATETFPWTNEIGFFLYLRSIMANKLLHRSASSAQASSSSPGPQASGSLPGRRRRGRTGARPSMGTRPATLLPPNSPAHAQRRARRPRVHIFIFAERDRKPAISAARPQGVSRSLR
jgi:hypothetical protein